MLFIYVAFSLLLITSGQPDPPESGHESDPESDPNAIHSAGNTPPASPPRNTEWRFQTLGFIADPADISNEEEEATCPAEFEYGKYPKYITHVNDIFSMK